MLNIKVSIIIPVFNCEEFIEECLDSLIHQTFQCFEIIVINDYCTDGTMEKVTNIKDSRIRVFNNIGTKGISTSLNLGIIHSKGQYIARMDADDISLKKRLRYQVDFMDSNPNIGVLGTQFKEMGEHNSRCKLPRKHDDILSGLLKGAILCHPTVMIRTELFKTYSYDAQFDSAEDYKLWIDMAKGGVQFYILSKVLLLKRAHNNRISTIKRTQQLWLSDIIRREFFELKFPFLNEIELNNVCVNRCCDRFVIKDFVSALSKILANSNNSIRSRKDVNIIYRDTIYRLDPHFKFGEFIELMRFKYPYFALRFIDILRLFKRTIVFKNGK